MTQHVAIYRIAGAPHLDRELGRGDYNRCFDLGSEAQAAAVPDSLEASFFNYLIEPIL